jgi:ATP-binding cassette subfamily F protein 3
MESYIARFKAQATKARQAQSRIKALERMEELTAAHVDSPFDFVFRESQKISSPLLTCPMPAWAMATKPSWRRSSCS